jgi:hypothetical protein
MHPQFAIALALLGIGALIWCVCLPLISRKVPMNRWYGIRVRQAFFSDQHWYDINEYGGRAMSRWSMPIVFVGVLGLLVPLRFFVAYCCLAGAIVLVSMVAPLIQIVHFSKTVDRRAHDAG